MKTLVIRVWEESKGLLERELTSIGGSAEDITDEEYGMSTTLPNGAWLQVYLAEQHIREGEGDGLAWTSVATLEGGEISGQCTPFNYGPNLWTKDERMLSVRLRDILSAWAKFKETNGNRKVTLTLELPREEFTRLGHSMSVAGFRDLVELSRLFFEAGRKGQDGI